tara:strand:- start:93 stop:887 length:795 start_codon:yes stop_codon:yes gene_type:complete
MTTKIPVELSSTPGIVDNSNATAITIDSNENVGIGITNPSDYYSEQLVVNAEEGEGGITIKNATNNTGYLMFADGTSGSDAYRGYIMYGHASDELRVYSSDFMSFYTAGASRARIDSHGLKFGTDTAAANALDDYEEGTWTPTAPQTTALAALYGARYIKIGRMVHAKCYIAFTPANNTTTFTIDGLPYTAHNVTDYGQGSVGYVNQSNINKLCDPIVNPNTNTIIFYYNDGTTGGSSVKNNFWHTATSGGNQLIIVSVLYETA